MPKLTSFSTFLVAICAISVQAAPAIDSGAATNNDDIGIKMKENAVLMNKTNNEKSLKMAGKSMRPPAFVAMPYYPPPPLRFQRAPTKYDSFGRPMNSPFVRRPTPTAAYMGYQPAQMYPGYAPFVPVPHRTIPPVFNYQHQPLLPSTYNYAPYAANTYASYGYRSGVEEEQPVVMDSSIPTNDQDKTIHLMKPEVLIYEEPQYSTSEYTLPNMDSTSSQVQPREMFVMGSPNKYNLMDDKISVNYMSPIAEPNDSVFWEMKRPYGYIVRPPTYPEMESHHLSYRFSEPSGNYPVQSRQYLIDSSNWALQGGENVSSMLIM